MRDGRRALDAVGAAAAVVVVLTTALIGRLFGPSQLADVVMVELLGIVVVALRWGLYPSLIATVLSVLSLDFFFIPPVHTLGVSELHHLATFAVMFIVAVVISLLMMRLRDQADAASKAQLRVETEQLKNALLSSVSHDLRTPLAIITGAASTLLRGRVDESSRRELTETVLAESEHLDRLVRNLLDMTRLEAGAVEVKAEWQPIEETVGAALDRVDLGGRTTTIDLPSDLPLVAYDAVLLQQVFVNLLENAVKYSPERSELTIAARAKGRRDEVEVEVADRGAGLPPGQHEAIFDKFHRAMKGRGGFGLGLTICRAIVTAHGGKIWAEDRPGGGTTFRFTLPIVGSPPVFEEGTAR